jgi:hypothetical protein
VTLRQSNSGPMFSTMSNPALRRGNARPAPLRGVVPALGSPTSRASTNGRRITHPECKHHRQWNSLARVRPAFASRGALRPAQGLCAASIDQLLASMRVWALSAPVIPARGQRGAIDERNAFNAREVLP